jgi:coenzyme F420-0:L-glutamate ligase/coenzyme F420-1:gamma-L-glutamate ligase
MQPPQDDLFSVLDESLTDVRKGDVVVVTSKVVAIHEGRCVKAEDFDKDTYIKEAAQLIIPRSYWGTPLTITNNMFVSSSGVDQSNSGGYYTLLPKEPFLSAQKIQEYLVQRFGTAKIGVIVTDSHSVPCRYGAIVGAISWWGFEPLLNHIGREDLFGRKIEHERSNLVDGIAAGAGVVMGEVNECTPVVIARGVPGVTFTDADTKDTLFCPPGDDTMRVLYERFL